MLNSAFGISSSTFKTSPFSASANIIFGSKKPKGEIEALRVISSLSPSFRHLGSISKYDNSVLSTKLGLST